VGQGRNALGKRSPYILLCYAGLAEGKGKRDATRGALGKKKKEKGRRGIALNDLLSYLLEKGKRKRSLAGEGEEKKRLGRNG